MLRRNSYPKIQPAFLFFKHEGLISHMKHRLQSHSPVFVVIFAFQFSFGSWPGGTCTISVFGPLPSNCWPLSHIQYQELVRDSWQSLNMECSL